MVSISRGSSDITGGSKNAFMMRACTSSVCVLCARPVYSRMRRAAAVSFFVDETLRAADKRVSVY